MAEPTASTLTSIVSQPGTQPRLGVDLAWLCLTSLILIHAGLSQPAPAGFGMIEIAIGLLLMLFCGWRQPLAVMTVGTLTKASFSLNERLLGAVFLIMVWLGTLRATAAGASIDDALRDFIPLAFLFLCLLVAPRLRTNLPILLIAVICCVGGALFAWRFFIWTELPIELWGQVSHPTGLNYLANSPLVPFAACFGPVWLVFRPSTVLRRPVLAMALLAIALLAWAAMATTTQRAPLGISLVILMTAITVFGVRTARGQVSRSDVLIALAVGIPLLTLAAYLTGTIGPAFIEKTRLVGGNARLLEWSAVWQAISANPMDLIWGLGWGAHYASPAVGNYQVGYAHGLAPYLLLKLGLIGLAALALWLVVVVRWLVQCCRISALSAAIALASLPALIPALLFYTSYKHLGLGVLLLLISAAASKADHPSQSA
ncbi:MAG: hypothetical protein KI792_02585 [Alphaproteobacteria bacterium]|nr:hypothetical protein [Alphaproteobacteria bacterium SS10]